MKGTIFIFLLLCGISLQGQENWTLERKIFSGNVYHVDGIRQSHKQTLGLLKDWRKQRLEYQAGRRDRILGNILGYGGLVAAYSVILQDHQYRDVSSGEQVLFWGGMGSMIAGSILTMTGEKKVIWSYIDVKKHAYSYYLGTDVDDYHTVINNQFYTLDRKRVSFKKTGDILKASSEAYRYYEKAKKSNKIFWIGTATWVGGLTGIGISYDQEFDTGINIAAGAFVGGAVLSLIAVIQIESRISKAIEHYVNDGNILITQNQVPQKNNYPATLSLGSAQHGVGMTLTF